MKFTGGLYDNLGGYTIMTSVPEPYAYAMTGGLTAPGMALMRRRRAWFAVFCCSLPALPKAGDSFSMSVLIFSRSHK